MALSPAKRASDARHIAKLDVIKIQPYKFIKYSNICRRSAGQLFPISLRIEPCRLEMDMAR